MLFYAHAGLMVAGVFLMAAGLVVARLLKKKRWWLKAHQGLEVSAILVLSAAFLCGFLMVAASGTAHFAVRHACVGAIVFLLALATMTVGILQWRIRGMAARLRPLHRWSGRATLVLYLVNMGLGLSLAGIW